jgi:hypothetical protein
LLLFDEIHLLLLASQGVKKGAGLTRADLPLFFLLGGICRLGLLTGLRSRLRLLLFVRALEFTLLLLTRRG